MSRLCPVQALLSGVEDALADDHLVLVLPGYSARHLPLALVYANRRN